MTMPREQYEKEPDTVNQQIVNLLDANLDQAFSLSEIAKRLGVEPLMLSFRLRELVQLDLIGGKTIYGTDYYGMDYYASKKPPTGTHHGP